MNEKSNQSLVDVQNILQQYQGVPITLRQLYYRLVAKGMPNNNKSYHNLISATIRWRKKNILPMDAFTDRARNIMTYASGVYYHDPKRWLLDEVERMLVKVPYDLSLWYEQPYRVTIGVEKNALVGVFNPVCDKYGVDLLPCVGYPSLSFLREFSMKINYLDEGMKDDVKDVFLYFGDWDPSGLNIPKTLNSNMHELFDSYYEYKHVALEPDQIEKYNLIPAPAKQTDSRTKVFEQIHGNKVYELDALDPSVLQNLIENSILKYINVDILKKREKTIAEGRKIIEEMGEKFGMPLLTTKLEEIRKALKERTEP